MRLGKRFRVVEDAGVGKTVFTRRLRAYLSSEVARNEFFGGNPPLVALWEETTGSWPKTGIKSALEKEVAKNCDHSAAEIVDYALQSNRVVIILDAMDQAGNAQEIQSVLFQLKAFLEGEGRQCWVILTGRPLIMDIHLRELPTFQEWVKIGIEEFDVFQQYSYLYGPDENELESLFAGIYNSGQLRIITTENRQDIDWESEADLVVIRLVEEAYKMKESLVAMILQRQIRHYGEVNDLLEVVSKLLINVNGLASELHTSASERRHSNVNHPADVAQFGSESNGGQDDSEAVSQ